MTAPAPAPAPSRSGQRSRILLAVAAAVIAIWTAGWFFLSGLVNDRLNVEIDRLADRGIVIECRKRSVGGFPFRVEIDCAGSRLTLRRTGTRGTLGGLRAVGLIYNPWHVIIEADAPLAAEGQFGQRVDGRWTRLQSSVRILDRGLLRGALAADGVDLALTLPGETAFRLTAGHVETHARPAAAGADSPGLAVDWTALATGLTLAAGDFTIGPRDMKLAVDATLDGLPRPPYVDGAATARQWVANGGALTLKSAVLDVGGARVDASGTLSPDIDGALSGQLRLVAHGLDKLGSGGVLGLPEDMSIFASAFLMFGKVEKQGDQTVRVLELAVDRGAMTLGRLPLGSLPPLF